MHKFIFFILTISICGLCCAEVQKEGAELLTDEIPSFPSQDEEEAIDILISLAEKRLEIQKELKELARQFKEEKDLFIKGEQSKSHASRMVGTARKILEIVADQNISYLFSSDYLDELAFFSSIAGKNAPVRP
jgi:hypothetical protein